MKKTLTFLLAACAWCIAQAGDDNTFYFNDAVILPGGTANLKLLVSSIDGHLLKGEEGVILAFAIAADDEASVGKYTMETVGESLLVSNDANAYYSAGVMGNILITDDPTSINEGIRMKGEESDAIYNLAGQRVGKTKNGVFIKGGRKILKQSIL